MAKNSILNYILHNAAPALLTKELNVNVILKEKQSEPDGVA